jgi:serine/threonine-protein kinase
VLGKKPVGEPLIGASQRFLDAPLSLAAVAAELGGPPGSAQALRPVFGLRPLAGLGLSPLASEGSIRRDTWEDCYDRVVRDLGLGVPVLLLDALTRRNVVPDGVELDVVLATNKPNHIFAPGDEMVITVTNRAAKPLHVELIGTSARGRKVILTPAGTTIAPGGSLRYPDEGSIRIQGGLGKEQITLFASAAAFPAGELLRGNDVADRVLHRFDFGNPGRGAAGFDPAHVLKKTIEIETR